MTDGGRRKANLRVWTLETYGDGTTAPCEGCGALLDDETLTLDRFPIPGKYDGTYRRGNVRPMCALCNGCHVNEPGYVHREEYGGPRRLTYELRGHIRADLLTMIGVA